MSFTPDDNLRTVAEAFALDACDFLRDHFRVTLDWSDVSIQQIELVLDTFHCQVSEGKPTQEQVASFSKMFGSYIGEVFRKNHGAAWGLVEINGQQIPGLQAQTSNLTFWPWTRVKNRIVQGAESNVWHYYTELVRQTLPGS